MSGRPKHNGGTWRVTFGCVTSQVVRPRVSFCFDYFSGQILPADTADKDFSDKIAGNFKGGTGVEGSGKPQIARITQIN